MSDRALYKDGSMLIYEKNSQRIHFNKQMKNYNNSAVAAN